MLLRAETCLLLLLKVSQTGSDPATTTQPLSLTSPPAPTPTSAAHLGENRQSTSVMGTADAKGRTGWQLCQPLGNDQPQSGHSVLFLFPENKQTKKNQTRN